MAGEIQEPFRLSFQGDSIHSGSISFGRFETEPLLWERRSSFTHNRYLEEVEKYSRPGSVTEKKAYFEAHFKRKALGVQSSSDCQNGTGYQTSENEISENTDYGDEYKHSNDGGHSARHGHFDEGGGDSDYEEDYGGSDINGDCVVTESERDVKDISCVEIQFDKALQVRDFESQLEPSADDFVFNIATEHVNTKDEDQSLTESLCEIKDVQGEPMIENLNGEIMDADLICEFASLSTECDAKDVSPRLDDCRKSCQKVGKFLENNLTKPKVKVLLDVTQCSETSNNSTKKTARPVKGVSHSTVKELRNSMAKLNHDKRDKVLKIEKVVEAKLSVSEKVVSKTCQNHRPKLSENSTKSDTKSNSESFSFKSDQQAERRKQVFMKLEEKLHEKEAEITQIQAKIQEKTEAEIKMFRKSLNFKATPMPSFYHVAAERGPIKDKAISNNSRIKVQSKFADPVCDSRRSYLSHPRAGNPLSKAEFVKKSGIPRVSGKSNCCQTRPMSLQNHRVSACSNVKRDHKVEEMCKPEVPRMKNGMVKKGTKGIGTCNASKVEHLAERVAT